MDLKTWREGAGLTQKEAAKLCDVPWRSWWRWEAGRVEPSLEAADKIIRGTGGKVTLAALAKPRGANALG
jgi:DNA-binding XRE family transcriptional regulator